MHLAREDRGLSKTMIVREPAAAHLSLVVDVAFYRKSDAEVI
jgi:hypothetical protein